MKCHLSKYECSECMYQPQCEINRANAELSKMIREYIGKNDKIFR